MSVEGVNMGGRRVHVELGKKGAALPWDDGRTVAKRVTLTVAVLLTGATTALGVLMALHARLGALAEVDRNVQAWVHGWASPWMMGVMLAMTGLGKVVTFLPAVSVVAAWMTSAGDRRRAVMLVLAVAGAMALNEGLKMHFQRARPLVAWAVGHEETFSFPSGHALFAVALYGTLACLAWRGAAVGRRCGLVVLACALSLGIGVSRVYLGAHWPTDVLAGYAVGSVWVGAVAVVDWVWRT